jgi:hypothetical protein
MRDNQLPPPPGRVPLETQTLCDDQVVCDERSNFDCKDGGTRGGGHSTVQRRERGGRQSAGLGVRALPRLVACVSPRELEGGVGGTPSERVRRSS